MKIVYLSNIFHHLQKPLSDELFRLTNGEYVFVETEVMQKGMAYQGEKAKYVIQYNERNKDQIEQLVNEADVVLYGHAPISLVRNRYKAHKLTFYNTERRYKHISRYLKWPIYTLNSLTFNKGYLLCASAYGARDFFFSGMPIRKCFKWGYFPAVRVYDNIDNIITNKRSESDGVVQIFWTGRLVKVKYPISVVYVAKYLRGKGYNFIIKVVGDGPLRKQLIEQIEKYDLQDCVVLLGQQPPEKVRQLMEESDIYLFTSGRGEGWGAVLNESMNSACAVIANPAAGSTPYLIKDNFNGLYYHNNNWKELCEKVKWLIDHSKERREIEINAYNTVVKSWNPKTAANNLIVLSKALLKGQEPSIKEGPCSGAEYIPQW